MAFLTSRKSPRFLAPLRGADSFSRLSGGLRLRSDPRLLAGNPLGCDAGSVTRRGSTALALRPPYYLAPLRPAGCRSLFRLPPSALRLPPSAFESPHRRPSFV